MASENRTAIPPHSPHFGFQEKFAFAQQFFGFAYPFAQRKGYTQSVSGRKKHKDENNQIAEANNMGL
ncbi:MAG: hypothetical protein MUP04_01910, partial [Anaerolineae bacterium]|nr:hypothetical protein [Anaerolineae bacterium]